MAHLLRLIALLCLLASGTAAAQSHPYYPSESTAFSACNQDKVTRAAQYYPHQLGPCVRGNGGQPLTCGGPWPEDQCYIVEWRHAETNVTQWQGIARIGVSPEDCDSRNDDPAQKPGPGLYLDANVGDKCVGGCTLTVVGNPIEVVQGRVQGQPANFYRFNREYSGETCGDDTPADSDEFQPVPDNPTRQCNSSAGVCVDSNGDTEYCSFDSQGNPLTCVPAVDYDNDGQADQDDADPGTPQDGNDNGEGNESDNQASGGADCTTAPTCTGDGIACVTLYQQWKTRCAVESLRIAVGGGGTNEYQEIEAGDLGDANDFGDAGVTADQAWRPEGEGGPGESPIFDDSGWLSNRSCPVIPTVNTSVMGQSLSLDFNSADLCWFLSLGAQLVLVFAALQSIRIYSKVI